MGDLAQKGEGLDIITRNLEKLGGELGDIGVKLENVDIKNFDDLVKILPKSVQKAIQEADVSEQANELYENIFEQGMKVDLEQQKRVKSIIDTTSAIGELAFA